MVEVGADFVPKVGTGSRDEAAKECRRSHRKTGKKMGVKRLNETDCNRR
jgi:hypothetical protein